MQERIKGLFKSQEEEKELIDDFDSLLKVVRLTYVTTHWRLRLFCIIWVSRLFLKTTPCVYFYSICCYIPSHNLSPKESLLTSPAATLCLN